MSNEPKKNFFAVALEKCKNFFIGIGKGFKKLFGKKSTTEQVTAEAQTTNTEGTVTLNTKRDLPFKEKLARFLRAEQGWLFVLPAIILLCIFTFYPIINAFVGALKQNYNDLTGEFDGWGFENFVRVLKGDTGMGGATFLQCLVNTLIFTFISVPLSTLLALLISVALNSIKAVQKAYQTVLFLPYLTNSLAMGAVFATFFTVVRTPNKEYTVGIVNNIIRFFGGSGIDWVKGQSMDYKSLTWQIGSIKIPWPKYVVVIVYEIWSGLPFKILILFSALQSVNKQYYDAAKIDGASKSKILWKITTPLIMPMISYLIITGIMGGMKQYTAIVGLFGTDMGFEYDMGTMVGYIYRYVDEQYSGYAFAGSLILFAIIMVITMINLQVTKKRVHY